MPVTKEETHLSALGHRIFLRKWIPDDIKTVVIIAHGMGEHSGRYEAVATRLAEAGYAVVAPDHRGHGRSMVREDAGDMGYDGWNETIRDLHRISRWADGEIGRYPQVLLGHSMGSMLAQQYLYLFGYTLSGCILSGSPGFSPRWRTLSGEVSALIEVWRSNPAAHSERLQEALFGNANNEFDGPAATGFEWLSRDEAEVQKYIDDPLCGFVLACGSLVGLFQGARHATDAANIATIPRTVPIYVFSGSDDPVHGKLKQLDRMIEAYTEAGLAVERRIYPGGRHEMLNETNREEVIEDCLAWLEDQRFANP